jgi:dimeric dUTPase (all-alpha-NTP-PPase superfamily)
MNPEHHRTGVIYEECVEPGIHLCKMIGLHSQYVNHLEDLGIKKTINKTRLKENILAHFTEAQDQYDGKHSIIILV